MCIIVYIISSRQKKTKFVAAKKKSLFRFLQYKERFDWPLHEMMELNIILTMTSFQKPGL
jgi:hypothetical protein